MKHKNIVGLVTLYYPDDVVIENINTYIRCLDKLYIVANSSISSCMRKRLYDFDNIEIIEPKENVGIAKAINIVLDIIKDRYKWCLTMDQDSSFYDGYIDDYLNVIEKIDGENVYGITSVINDDEKKYKNEFLVEAYECITSGMLLNVKLAIQCGGMDEKMFIDDVDYEFCYRCNEKGYKLYLYPKNMMSHKIGESKSYSILGFKFTSKNEKYFRLYYIFRNALYVAGKYSYVRKDRIKMLSKMIVKIILVEDDKIRKFRYIGKGLKDYFLNRMGKML